MFHAKKTITLIITQHQLFFKKKSLISIICFRIFSLSFLININPGSPLSVSIKNPFQLKNIKFSLNIYNKILLKQFFLLKNKLLLKTKTSLMHIFFQITFHVHPQITSSLTVIIIIISSNFNRFIFFEFFL